MEEMHEIKELLREIRDLQKAHFERYKEFTESIMARAQDNEDIAESARSEQRRYREEMRRVANNNEARIKSMSTSRWVALGIGLLILGLAVSVTFLSFILRLGLP